MKLVFPPHLTFSLVAETEEDKRDLWELRVRIERTSRYQSHPTLYLNGTEDEDEEKRKMKAIEFS